MKGLLLIAILSFLIIGCDSQDTMDYYYSKGEGPYTTTAMMRTASKMVKMRFMGQHRLEKLSGFMGISGTLEGSFLSGSSGELHSTGYIVYAWRHRNTRIFLHSLPMSLVDIQCDPEVDYPTIQYQYRLYYFHRDSNSALDSGLPLGMLISPKTIRKATIVISEEQLAEKEYLFW